jgi:hypothetical protein
MDAAPIDEATGYLQQLNTAIREAVRRTTDGGS